MTPRFDRGYLLGIVVLMAACLPVVARAEAPQPLDAGTLRALGIEQPQTVRASATPPLPRAVTPHSGAWSWTTGAYSYDGSGNITAIGTQSFLYDVRGRLVDATLTRPDQAGSQHYAYSYDAFGNLTSRTGASTISTPTDTATNHLNGATYDDAGNVTLVQPAGQSIQYEYRYDALNNVQQIRAANVSDETRQLYIYTADDERIWSFDLGTNSSHWTVRDLSGKVARDYFVPGDTWTLSRDYIYRDGMLLAAVTPAETLHFSLDHLGTPRVITNDSRVRVGFHHYLPFGQEWTDHSGAQEGERMKFTSHERDSDPGKGTIELDYMHARYYSPDMGRFLSADPVITKAALKSPQLWNRYAYVGNNPLNRVDPDGRLLQAVAGDAGTADDAFRRLQNLVSTEAAGFLKLNAKTGMVTLNGISRREYGKRFGATAGMIANLITTQGHTATFALANSKFAQTGGGGRNEPTDTGSRTEVGPGLIPKAAGGVPQNVESVLAHELGHALQDMYGIDPGTPGIGSIRRGYVISPLEGFAVWTENNYRAEKALPHRNYYLYGPWGDHGNDYIEP